MQKLYVNAKQHYLRLARFQIGGTRKINITGITKAGSSEPIKHVVLKGKLGKILSARDETEKFQTCVELVSNIEFDNSTYNVTFTVTDAPAPCTSQDSQVPILKSTGTQIFDNLFLAGVPDYDNTQVPPNSFIVSFIDLFSYKPLMKQGLTMSLSTDLYEEYTDSANNVFVYIIKEIDDDYSSDQEHLAKRKHCVHRFVKLMFDKPEETKLSVFNVANLIATNPNIKFYINCHEGKNRSVTYLIGVLLANMALLEKFCAAHRISPDVGQNIVFGMLTKLQSIRQTVWNSCNLDFMFILVNYKFFAEHSDQESSELIDKVLI